MPHRKTITPEIFEMKDRLASQQDDPEKQDEFLALMSTIEGHALFYTDQLVPGYAELERKTDMEENPGLAFIDMDETERQHQGGLKYVSKLYEEGGTEHTNLALAEPPESMEEINDYQKYLQRVNQKIDTEIMDSQGFEPWAFPLQGGRSARLN